jgi:hypothetical protein
MASSQRRLRMSKLLVMERLPAPPSHSSPTRPASSYPVITVIHANCMNYAHLKGTVAEDVLPLVFITSQPHLGPTSPPTLLINFIVESDISQYLICRRYQTMPGSVSEDSMRYHSMGCETLQNQIAVGLRPCQWF